MIIDYIAGCITTIIACCDAPFIFLFFTQHQRRSLPRTLNEVKWKGRTLVRSVIPIEQVRYKNAPVRVTTHRNYQNKVMRETRITALRTESLHSSLITRLPQKIIINRIMTDSLCSIGTLHR